MDVNPPFNGGFSPIPNVKNRGTKKLCDTEQIPEVEKATEGNAGKSSPCQCCVSIPTPHLPLGRESRGVIFV